VSIPLVVTVDTTAPTVVLEKAGGQADPVENGPVNFTATFSEVMHQFVEGDIATAGNLVGNVSVSGGPSTFSIAVEATGSEGFVEIGIPDGVAIDTAGNGNEAVTSSDSRVDLDSQGITGGVPTHVSLSGGLGMASGFLGVNDTDTFTFTLPEPRIAIIYTTGTTDTRGELRDFSATLLNDPVADDNAGNPPNFRISEPLPAGTYSVEASLVGVDGEYEIHFEAIDLPAIQPDVSINGRGVDIFGTPAGQTLSLVSRKARTVRGVASVRNDGEIPDSFLMSARRGNSLFRVGYSSTTSGNVTALLAAGIHETSLVGPQGNAETVVATFRPNKRKIRKKIRRGGKTITKYKKKRFNSLITARSTALSDRSDLGLIKVKTK